MIGISSMLEKMVLLFFCLACGYVGAKRKFLTEDGNRTISNLIINITNPFLILNSVMSGEHVLTNGQVLLLTGIAALCYVFTITTGRFLPKLLHMKGRDGSVLKFMYTFSNVGFIGYPIAESLFGPSAMFNVTIFVLTFQLFCFTYGTHLLSGEKQFRFNARKVLLTPCVISAVAAYIIYFTGVQCPAIIGNLCAYVGNLTSPLGMIVIGASLAKIPLKDIFSRWQVYVLVAVKMILVPLIAFFILRTFITNQLILGVTVLTLCMPVASNTTIISYHYGKDTRLASSGVFLTTLLSAVTIPVMMSLLFA